MLNIAVTGAAGRMGRNLIQACYENTNCQLGAAIEHESSPFIGRDAGELAGVGTLNRNIVSQLSEVADDFHTLIDFTRPEVTLKNLEFCVANNKNIIIGTTGFSDDEKQQIQLIRADGGEATALTSHEEGVNSFRWSPDGTRIVSGSRDGTIMVWVTFS